MHLELLMWPLSSFLHIEAQRKWIQTVFWHMSNSPLQHFFFSFPPLANHVMPFGASCKTKVTQTCRRDAATGHPAWTLSRRLFSTVERRAHIIRSGGPLHMMNSRRLQFQPQSVHYMKRNKSTVPTSEGIAVGPQVLYLQKSRVYDHLCGSLLDFFFSHNDLISASVCRGYGAKCCHKAAAAADVKEPHKEPLAYPLPSSPQLSIKLSQPDCWFQMESITPFANLHLKRQSCAR